MVFKYGRMGVNMKECGKMMWQMGWGDSLMQNWEVFTKEILLMTKLLDMVFLLIWKGLNMKDIGWMINNMGKAKRHLWMELHMKAFMNME